MVVVSGGGWGVGDIAGAVREFTRVPEVTQHRVPGGPQRAARDRAAARRSPATSASACTASPTGCPSCWPPPTCSCTPPAGVTCLEAMAAGTPVVSYGLPVGHARLNTRAMADLDLLRLATTPTSCASTCRRASPRGRDGAGTAGWRPRCDAEPPAAVERRAGRATARAADPPLAAAAGRARDLGWAAARRRLVGDVDRRGDRRGGEVPRVHPLAHVHDRRARRRRWSSTPPSACSRGSPASWQGAGSTSPSPTAPGVPSRERIAELRSLGDELLPEVPGSAPLRWERTRGQLRSQARALGTHRRFYYLQPRGGLSVGQLVLARTAGATPVKGALRVSATAPAASPPDAGGRRPGSRTRRLRRLGARARADRLRLGSERLGAEPLRLADAARRSISASSSGERASIAAPPTSSASDSAQRDAAERRVAEALAEQQRREHRPA